MSLRSACAGWFEYIRVITLETLESKRWKFAIVLLFNMYVVIRIPVRDKITPKFRIGILISASRPPSPNFNVEMTPHSCCRNGCFLISVHHPWFNIEIGGAGGGRCLKCLLSFWDGCYFHSNRYLWTLLHWSRVASEFQICTASNQRWGTNVLLTTTHTHVFSVWRVSCHFHSPSVINWKTEDVLTISQL